jgi:xylulokinase
MTGRLALGVDIGTTAVKALVLDADTGLFATAAADSHQLRSPQAGWAEEDPADWLHGAVQAVRRLGAAAGVRLRDVGAIGVSGMVPTVVALDEDRRPVRPSIQQNDARTIAELADIERAWPAEAIFRRAGSTLNQQHVLPKLLWLRAHEPGSWARVRSIVGSYDYVRGWLTGRYGVERNWAVESGMYDVRRGGWMGDLLSTFSIDAGLLGGTLDPWDVTGELQPEAAQALGLVPSIPVLAGSADHVASALACGVAEPGDTLIKFGGAGDLLYCTDTPVFHPDLYFDYHDMPERYLLNGCMAASGSLVRWLLDRFGATEADTSELSEAAAAIGPGSDGLVVLPYFLGEKTPILDPAARGVIFGLLLHHGDAHLFRAVLESVVYGFRHHVDVLESAGHRVGTVLAGNGGARSPLWRQIAADVLGREVTAFPRHPGSALGVAYLAAQGAGLRPRCTIKSITAADAVVHQPDARAQRTYDTGYRIYRELYTSTRHLLPLAAALSDPLAASTSSGRVSPAEGVTHD